MVHVEAKRLHDFFVPINIEDFRFRNHPLPHMNGADPAINVCCVECCAAHWTQAEPRKAEVSAAQFAGSRIPSSSMAAPAWIAAMITIMTGTLHAISGEGGVTRGRGTTCLRMVLVVSSRHNHPVIVVMIQPRHKRCV